MWSLLMGVVVVAAAPLLQPGWYGGRTSEGRVWLILRPDGTAQYGGADLGWRLDGAHLQLLGAQTLDLEVESGVDGVCLKGPPFGRICLAALAVPQPDPPPERLQPAAWVGRWRHEATGGSLTLELGADGRYRMVQAVVGDQEAETGGAWHGDADGLVLEPDGGTPLRYRAKRAGSGLQVGGGDLPMEVHFVVW